ncbi:hypothetical protein BU24DRAFT_421772 [Aaosphaeria arxii CBS 175.79]|uniref:Uncharacterized protein n=1 Tax=Aaosphaeria arxii CBS 175.79 TaxID=1450172 RepID=A0A6A5XQC4_9PLEO|nr:uncharacterized protein BU24DRAFT_421772 [Aaosphaeria arxii CBS 175.79]KAF2015468.1 hypothetical protein BU24DRAFT_421772 [Aaosphaeria arxii CBS 175.79]
MAVSVHVMIHSLLLPFFVPGLLSMVLESRSCVTQNVTSTGVPLKERASREVDKLELERSFDSMAILSLLNC